MTNFSVRIFAMALACVAILSACSNTSYKKTSSGLMYKIISTGKAPQVKIGEILKVQYVQKINDSILFDSYGKMPAYAKVDSSVGQQYNPSEIFHLLHKGDSAVVVQFVDSLMKTNPMGLPPYMKKGDKLTISFKVLEVFANDDLARADGEKEMELEKVRVEKEGAAKIIEQAKEMESYLADKKINAQKTGKGTFVEIKSQGTGAQADSGKYVSVRYTGKLFETGKEFENNVEGGKPPFSFVLGTHQVIQGWDEGLKLLKKGAKATLYIPGALAYGPRPGPGGAPYESLIFDVELVDVSDSAPAQQHPAMPPTGGGH